MRSARISRILRPGPPAGDVVAVARSAQAGYQVGITGSLWLLGLVALIGIPVGVGAGVFLENMRPRDDSGRSFRRTSPIWPACLRSSTEFWAWLFVRAFGFKAIALGPTLLAGVLTLSLLILPIIVITTQEALRAVPPRCARRRWPWERLDGRWCAITFFRRPCRAS